MQINQIYSVLTSSILNALNEECNCGVRDNNIANIFVACDGENTVFHAKLTNWYSHSRYYTAVELLYLLRDHYNQSSDATLPTDIDIDGLVSVENPTLNLTVLQVSVVLTEIGSGENSGDGPTAEGTDSEFTGETAGIGNVATTSGDVATASGGLVVSDVIVDGAEKWVWH